MSCGRAFEIDLEDLLAAPESVEHQEFEAHCTSCRDCAGQLALHKSLLGQLRGEPPRARDWHPSDQSLLLMRSNAVALGAGEEARIRLHFSDCVQCRDAFQALRSLTALARPEPARSFLRELLEGSVSLLESLIRPLASPAVGSALVVVLAVAGLLWVSDPFGIREETGGLRGVERGIEPRAADLPLTRVPPIGAFEVTLLASERGEVAGRSLPEGEPVILNLLLPDSAPWQDEFIARVHEVGGDREIRRLIPVAEGARRRVALEIEPDWLAPGEYGIELYDSETAAVPVLEYTLDVL